MGARRIIHLQQSRGGDEASEDEPSEDDMDTS